MGHNSYDVDRPHFGFKLMPHTQLSPPIFSIWHKLFIFSFHFIQIVVEKNGLLATAHQVTTPTFLIYEYITITKSKSDKSGFIPFSPSPTPHPAHLHTKYFITYAAALHTLIVAVTKK